MGAPRLHGPGWLPLNDSAGIDMQIGLEWRERETESWGLRDSLPYKSSELRRVFPFKGGR